VNSSLNAGEIFSILIYKRGHSKKIMTLITMKFLGFGGINAGSK